MTKVESWILLSRVITSQAGLQGSRHTTHIDENVDWNMVASISYEQNLLHLLASPKLLSAAPPEFAEAIHIAASINKNRNMAILHQIKQIGEDLNRIGVTPLLLKGAASLVLDLYRRPEHRYLGDLDILVPVSQLQEVRRALHEIGYRARADLPDKFNEVDPSRHHIWPLEHKAHPAPVEVHFGVCHTAYEHLLPTGDAWQNACPLTIDDIHFFVLPPKLALLHDFIHAQLADSGFFDGDIRLRRLLEFSLLRQLCTGTGDLDWVRQRLISAGFGTAFTTYMTLANELMVPDQPQRRENNVKLRLARTRMWLHIRYPVFTRAMMEVRAISSAVKDGRCAALFKQILQPEWYRRKRRALRNGRRYS